MKTNLYPYAIFFKKKNLLYPSYQIRYRSRIKECHWHPLWNTIRHILHWAVQWWDCGTESVSLQVLEMQVANLNHSFNLAQILKHTLYSHNGTEFSLTPLKFIRAVHFFNCLSATGTRLCHPAWELLWLVNSLWIFDSQHILSHADCCRKSCQDKKLQQ